MAVKYQAVGTYQSGVADLTVAWPTHTAGDIGILLVETMDQYPGGTWPPTDWTNLTGAAVSGKVALFMAWRRANSSSEGSITVGDSGDHQSAVIFTVRGAPSIGDPFREVLAEDCGSITAGGTGGMATALGACEPYDLLVIVGAHDADQSTANFSNWLNSYSLGYTERFDSSNTQGSGGGLGIATVGQASTAPGQAQVNVTAASYLVLAHMCIKNAETDFMIMF